MQTLTVLCSSFGSFTAIVTIPGALGRPERKKSQTAGQHDEDGVG